MRTHLYYSLNDAQLGKELQEFLKQEKFL